MPVSVMRLQRRQFNAVLGTLIGVAVLAPRLSWAGVLPDGSVRRYLRFSFTLENPFAHVLREQRLWFYMPAQITACQSLSALTIDVPHQISHDRLGNTIVELPLEMPPYASRIVNVRAEVLLRSRPISEELVFADLFLNAEPYIEVDRPEIQTLAATLKQDTPQATARAIYDWVRRHLQYSGYVADDQGAYWALQNLRGDCTEYAYLAVALARACGLPARMLGGYVLDRDAAPRAADYHNWAEIYVGSNWLLLDAQKETFDEKYAQYIVLRIVSGRVSNSMGLAHRFVAQGDLHVRME